MGVPHTERKARCTVHLYPNLETINTSRTRFGGRKYLWQPFSISKQSQTQTRNMVQYAVQLCFNTCDETFYATYVARTDDST